MREREELEKIEAKAMEAEEPNIEPALSIQPELENINYRFDSTKISFNDAAKIICQQLSYLNDFDLF